jgi:disulfide bond formation protein DsbB
MINLKPRGWFLLGFISCFAMLAIGAYFQFIEELEPCPLCISQRVAILIAGIIFLLAVLHNPSHKGVITYAVIGTIAALCGAAVSARHVWLQNLPPEQVPECGPGLEYVFENFPLTETLKLLLNGTGECAEVLWTFMDISIPGWTLLAFISLAVINLLQILNDPDD